MRRTTSLYAKRRLFRGTLALILFAALLAGLRLAWGASAARRLEGARARLKAQGVPVTTADWPDPAMIPAEQDALTCLRAAIDLVDKNLSDDALRQKAALTRGSYASWPTEDAAALKRFWSASQPGLAELDRAATLKDAAWPLDPTQIHSDHLEHSNSGMLENLLIAQAIVDGTERQWPDFFANLQRLATIARINGQSTEYWPLTESSALTHEIVGLLERFETEINWRDDANAACARAFLIRLQEPGPADLSRHAYVSLVSIQAHIRGHARQWWLTPLLQDNEARLLDHFAPLVPASRAVSWPQFKSRMPAALPPYSSWLSTAVQHLSNAVDLEYSALFYFQDTAVRRAASVLIAARLYQHDHGNLPRSAGLLVPDYLSELPADPYDPANAPIRYRLDPGGPTLWSIGEDGIDGGGSVSVSIRSRQASDRFRTPDMLMGAQWREILAANQPSASVPAVTAPASMPQR